MDGVLLFNKPILWTSHDAVDFIRRRLDQKAVGHAGTLDPMATGLLVLLVGKATKWSQELSVSDKDYSGTMRLGLVTDTQDLEGRIVKESSFNQITEIAIKKAVEDMIGEQDQKPPAYSAVKLRGKKLYQWARQGVAVQVEAKKINVMDFRIIGIDFPEVHFSLSCSKGTYVRSLCDRAGEVLGCGATLSSLVRQRSGNFFLSQALSERDVRTLGPNEIKSRLCGISK